jgi:hypothetical protein
MVANLAEAKTHPIAPDAFLRHDAAIVIAKREMEDALAAVARAKKAAKKDAVNPLAYKFMEQIRKLDEDERPIVVRTFMEYCSWLNMPIGTQASLIDAPKVPKQARTAHAVAQASEAGLQAGREGEPASMNPHRPGSEEHVAWSRQHTLGLTERATAAKMLDTEVERVADTAKATRHPAQGRGKGRRTASAALESAHKHLNGGAPAH